MSLVLLVSCPRGQEVNTQAAPGTLIRQHCWQGSGWPGSPGPALALGWPGTLEGSEGALGEHSGVWRENTVGCGGLAVSSQRVGPAIFAPPSPPGPLPTLLHDLTSPWVSVYGWSRLLGRPGPSVAVAGFLGAWGLSSCSWGRQLALPQAVMPLLAPRCRLMSACELKGCGP